MSTMLLGFVCPRIGSPCSWGLAATQLTRWRDTEFYSNTTYPRDPPSLRISSHPAARLPFESPAAFVSLYSCHSLHSSFSPEKNALSNSPSWAGSSLWPGGPPSRVLFFCIWLAAQHGLGGRPARESSQSAYGHTSRTSVHRTRRSSVLRNALHCRFLLLRLGCPSSAHC